MEGNGGASRLPPALGRIAACGEVRCGAAGIRPRRRGKFSRATSLCSGVHRNAYAQQPGAQQLVAASTGLVARTKALMKRPSSSW